MHTLGKLPQPYQQNLDQAIKILKNGGCTAVYLFGSLTTGKFHSQSDIDLAVRGCPPEEFFHLLGELMFTLDYSVDLIDLDTNDLFARYLIEKGKLHQIG